MGIDDTYDSHPFQSRTILARLSRQHRTSALDVSALAVDNDTEITDQNHVGGAVFTLALADAAAVAPSDTVVDVGCGLGGSCRVIASARGCQVLGVENHEGRYRDAIELTAMVGMQSRVTFLHADALRDPLPSGPFDILWGQSAWVHFPDKGRFFQRWIPSLAADARVAMEDAYLRRSPETDEERMLVATLETSWHASLVALDEWQDAMAAAGFMLDRENDLTDECMEYFQRLITVSSGWPAGMLTPDERQGWRRALEAGERGLLGYCRLIAVRT